MKSSEPPACLSWQVVVSIKLSIYKRNYCPRPSFPRGGAPDGKPAVIGRYLWSLLALNSFPRSVVLRLFTYSIVSRYPEYAYFLVHCLSRAGLPQLVRGSVATPNLGCSISKFSWHFGSRAHSKVKKTVAADPAQDGSFEEGKHDVRVGHQIRVNTCATSLYTFCGSSHSTAFSSRVLITLHSRPT